mgnify:CR=1 FL=1
MSWVTATWPRVSRPVSLASIRSSRQLTTVLLGATSSRGAFSQRGRRGVASVPPMDANSQDVSVLIGSEDISKLDRYPEDDPRVLSLNGAFNVGNRGIVEMIEIFKNEIEFLHTIITATQEKRVPSPGKHDMIYFDGVIVAHCNEAEWNRFQSEHTNEAILDRIVKISFGSESLQLWTNH